MPLLEWTDRLSIGIKGIDEQHKTLVNMINKAYEATSWPDSRKECARLLERMRDYAMEHFTAEEYLMKGVDYPDLEAHKAEHQLFIDQLLSLTADGEEVTPEEIFAFLREWLVTHIMGTDAKLSPYFKDS
ncbi:bacteriohemerythrin [Salidesulfovibrio brasiliensis]|uniref:bacteriohemerythrin n=1 Tax=Salidesulfovibrio brasiliensis TaxID=221711 RepID=UPI0006CF3246|nr:bacteriohemerythrin [Salidesulfovibrio brasiliensis]